MKDILKKELDDLKSEGLHRSLKTIGFSTDRVIEIEGKRLLNFSSNNYLGLSFDERVVTAAQQIMYRYGCGGTASRLVAGTFEIHSELESKIAKLKHKEAALVFPTGYQANLGIIAALLKDGDCLIMDKLNHASLWDASKLCGARIFVYEHRDMESLEKVLERAKNYNRKLIVTDSVFSMDGDLAPLKDIAALAKKYNAWTMVDEAHATGVFGENGSGLAEYFGVEDRIDIVMGTLSKAIGSQGGFVCGSRELIDYLINKSRSLIYTTALSPSCTAAAIMALEIIQKEPQTRKRLLSNSKILRDNLKSSGFDTYQSESQIVPVFVGSIEKAQQISARLYEGGVFAPAMRPPTVPEGSCRLRFSLTSAHTGKDIDLLVETLKIAFISE